ncbi:MAG: hypothetical protein NXH75_05360 [Halobacteriovoraceae bacterium]|nr:hypothetical protein [Halobacteriovoraceae bacterium]
MVRVHLATFFTLLFLSPLVVAESDCDKLHNTYTVKCTDAETQCKGLTHCSEIQTKCIPKGTDLANKQTCGEFQGCLVDYYSEKAASNEGVSTGDQCKYKWNEPVVVNRGSSMKSCKFRALPWDPSSNHCPGASILYNGESLSDPFYNCQATKKKYLDLHKDCEIVKAQLNNQCSISIVENKGRNCPGLDLSPAEVSYYQGGVGEDPGSENAHFASEGVVDTEGLTTKPNLGFTNFDLRDWADSVSK